MSTLRRLSVLWWSDTSGRFRVSSLLTTPYDVRAFTGMRLGFTSEADARALADRLNAELNEPAPLVEPIATGDHVVRMTTLEVDADDD
jgi:hypothetical protein